MKKTIPIGAETVKTWTGAHLHIFLLNRYEDEEGKLCCAIICKDNSERFSASKFIHSHLSWDEALEVLENPGNMGMG